MNENIEIIIEESVKTGVDFCPSEQLHKSVGATFGRPQFDQYEELIEKVITKCYEIEQIEGYISITLTSNEEIRKINKQYRNIDKATDVLSFPMYEREDILKLQNNKANDIVKQIVLGDLIISIPKVIEQSKEYGHSVERELAYMLVHGFCHLIGFDHIEEFDKIIMRQEEEKILETLGIVR